MGTIMNLKDFRKELELLEHDNENPIADVWYDEILRGKSIFLINQNILRYGGDLMTMNQNRRE